MKDGPYSRAREREADWLGQWDEFVPSHILLRTLGLYPLPGANHIGGFIA